MKLPELAAIPSSPQNNTEDGFLKTRSKAKGQPRKRNQLQRVHGCPQLDCPHVALFGVAKTESRVLHSREARR